jgi:glycogen(starch) synthase
MRVLFWSETFWPRVGGVETLAVRLLDDLRVRGHEFQVVTWTDGREYELAHYKEIAIHRFPFFARVGDSMEPTLAQWEQVVRLKRAYSPDLVHVNSYGRSTWFHASTMAANRAPTLLSLHQALPEPAFESDTLVAKVLWGSDWITCCSLAVCEATARSAPALRSKLGVIRNAIPAPPLEPRPLPQDPPTLMFVGRLAPEKGLGWAFPALARVTQGMASTRLVIVGDGPLRPELEQRAIELGVVQSTVFMGEVPREAVPELLQQATILVIPSLAEGFGLVALEAALMGRPVVATNVGGLADVVQDSVTGVLVEPGDVEGLEEAVRSLLEAPDRAERLGRAARGRASAEFRWSDYVDAFEELYQRLASAPSATLERGRTSQTGILG